MVKAAVLRALVILLLVMTSSALIATVVAMLLVSSRFFDAWMAPLFITVWVVGVVSAFVLPQMGEAAFFRR